MKRWLARLLEGWAYRLDPPDEVAVFSLSQEQLDAIVNQLDLEL